MMGCALEVVWVLSDAVSMKKWLMDRNLSRDDFKVRNGERYIDGLRFGSPVSWAWVIDNRLSCEVSVEGQVQGCFG